MHTSLVVAVTQNRVIGRDGGMPWHLPGDLQYFKRVTMGKPVVMGRKTFESIGRPLPGRENIVITRDTNWSADGVSVVHTLETALIKAHERAQKDGVDEVMVIGGGQIYAAALGQATRVYLTEIQTTLDGDTVFPDLPENEWHEISRQAAPAHEKDDHALINVVYERN